MPLPDIFHDNGDAVTQGEWLRAQEVLLAQFAEHLGDKPENMFFYWTAQFAKAMRDVCRCHKFEGGVEAMSEFQSDYFFPHVALRKWVMSQLAKGDVKVAALQGVSVHSEVSSGENNQVLLTMTFPYVGNGGPGCPKIYQEKVLVTSDGLVVLDERHLEAAIAA